MKLPKIVPQKYPAFQIEKSYFYRTESEVEAALAEMSKQGLQARGTRRANGFEIFPISEVNVIAISKVDFTERSDNSYAEVGSVILVAPINGSKTSSPYRIVRLEEDEKSVFLHLEPCSENEAAKETYDTGSYRACGAVVVSE